MDTDSLQKVTLTIFSPCIRQPEEMFQAKRDLFKAKTSIVNLVLIAFGSSDFDIILIQIYIENYCISINSMSKDWRYIYRIGVGKVKSFINWTAAEYHECTKNKKWRSQMLETPEIMK